MTSYIPFQLLRSSFNFNSTVYVNPKSKKLDKKHSYLKGQPVKFLKLIGDNTASVSFKGACTYIPLEALLHYDGKSVLTDPTSTDTLFIVHSKNSFFQVGAVFTSSVINMNGMLYVYQHDNFKVPLDSSWVSALSSISDTSKLQSLSDKFNVIEEHITQREVQSLDPVLSEVEPITVSQEIKEEVLEVDSTYQITKDKETIFGYTSDDVNKFEMFKDAADEILSTTGTFYDISGKCHSTLIECLKTNQYYIDTAYLNAVVMASDQLLGDKE